MYIKELSRQGVYTHVQVVVYWYQFSDVSTLNERIDSLEKQLQTANKVLFIYCMENQITVFKTTSRFYMFCSLLFKISY